MNKHYFIIAGAAVFVVSLYSIARSSSLNSFFNQDLTSAQSVSCSSATLNTVGARTFADISYPTQISCLFEGAQIYNDDPRFTFFKTPLSLKGKEVAFIHMANIAPKSNPALSWTVAITRPADVYVFYRRIPGQSTPQWLSGYSKITTDSFSDLAPFLLRKNDLGLIGVYHVYRTSLSSPREVTFGPAYSSTGEAYSMYIVGVVPTGINQTIQPSPTRSSSPTPDRTPTPPGLVHSGIWISQQEIASLPTTGAAWNAVLATANGNIGTANMSDQNSGHPTRTIAVALAAVRLNNEALKTKAVDALISAIGTENNPDPDCAAPQFGARGLAIARNVIGYAIAADILNLRSSGYNPGGNGDKFQQWMDAIRHRKNCDSNGAAAFSFTLMDTPGTTSNGNSLGLASRLAAAGYLGDKADADLVWLAFRKYAGDTSVGPNYTPNSYSGNWKASVNPYVGINPKGAFCSGASSTYPADGAIPNDQGRGGNCPTNPNTAPGYTAYPWEGLQGAYAQAVILDRMGYKDAAGNDSWHVANSALLRAVQYQWYLQSKFGGSWYDPQRAAWVKHLAFYVYGYKPAAYASSGGGRNMDWTQWTFSR
ncbi:MAG: hypothetical protein M3Q44_08065 [bacterium]|nr:hypothetical protein [bacterium]